MWYETLLGYSEYCCCSTVSDYHTQWWHGATLSMLPSEELLPNAANRDNLQRMAFTQRPFSYVHTGDFLHSCGSLLKVLQGVYPHVPVLVFHVQ